MTDFLRVPFLVAAWTAIFVATTGTAVRGEEYKSYKDAYAAGAKAVKAGDLAAAREPFEAAAKLASTEREKLEAHRSLMVPYRELPDVAPMQTAAEFVIAHSTQPAEKSLTRSALLSFVHKRGKTDEVVKAYESRIEKDAADRTALYLLTESYATYKKDPVRAADRGEKYLEAQKKAGFTPDRADQSKLAELYVRADRPKEGAALFEAIAPGEAKTEAWHWKEGAAAWLKAGDKAKAVAAARKSAMAAAEARSDQLNYFWRRGLGDIFLDAGEPKEAVTQFEKALAATKNDGYIKSTNARLEQARSAAGK